jgi:hypothetical protein
MIGHGMIHRDQSDCRDDARVSLALADRFGGC